jgi:hypothetical protein
MSYKVVPFLKETMMYPMRYKPLLTLKAKMALNM